MHVSGRAFMTVLEIGCCGAYCRTCKAYKGGFCKGCKLGYSDGSRNIERAKCAMKLCCFRDRGLQTCADCKDLESCGIIQPWFKKGYKYRKCKEYLEFIKRNGYTCFVEKADKWNDANGKL